MLQLEDNISPEDSALSGRIEEIVETFVNDQDVIFKPYFVTDVVIAPQGKDLFFCLFVVS